MADAATMSAWLAGLRGALTSLRGELARRYRWTLRELFDCDVRAETFHVDRIGFCLEVAREHGLDYLGFGAANPFAVIVTPRQRNARLLRGAFSFEKALIDAVYAANDEVIRRLTRRDVVYGEIEEGVSFLHDPGDLLLIRRASLQLQSLQGMASDLRELEDMSERLGVGDNLLEDSYVHRMLVLVSRLKGVHSPGLRPVPVTRTVDSFACDLLGGVYVLRPNEGHERRTLLLYPDAPSHRSDANLVFADWRSSDVIHLLHREGLITFLTEPKRLERQMTRLENDLLVSRNIDVVSADAAARKRALTSIEKELPDWFWEVRDILRQATVEKLAPDQILATVSPSAALRLAQPARAPEVIGHLLAALDPSDYGRLFRYNPMKLFAEFSAYPPAKQSLVTATVTMDWCGITP